MMLSTKALVTVAIFTFFGAAQAQHLIYRPKDDQGSYRCIYGEIDVLATGPTTYFCGCNWWPSAPAGGYTGIQDLETRQHKMIFSVWDTDTKTGLNSLAVDMGDPRAELSRFGGEGDGAKTMLAYNWRIAKTYRYFIVKRQDKDNNVTLASAYFFDDYLGTWVYDATIASPSTDKSVKGFGGMMNAFLENYGGKDKDTPRLALYRLWVGTAPSNLTNVTEASGDGMWGVLNDSFFLASGEEAATTGFVRGSQIGEVEPVFGKGDRLHVSDHKLPADVLRSLQKIAGN